MYWVFGKISADNSESEFREFALQLDQKEAKNLLTLIGRSELRGDKIPPTPRPAMVSLVNAPRDFIGILQLKRGIRYRIAMQLGIFKDDDEEHKYLSAPDPRQSVILCIALADHDYNKYLEQGNTSD